MNRSNRLAAVDNKTFDVVVIGGGIIGASSAQQAAAEGYSVLLVEKNDFASGATSRSSRLLHCGLRYFEALNPLHRLLRHPGRLITALRMARQAMQARREFVQTSSTRVRALNFLFPIYEDTPFSSRQIDLAFGILGSLAPKDVPLDYKRLRREEALKNPLVQSLGQRDKLLSVAQFTEYQFNWPERVCIDTVLDAERMGATVLNYTEATLGEMVNDEREVILEGIHGSGEMVKVRARRVLTMAGVWIDGILKKTSPTVTRKSFGTKGAHIVVKLPDCYRGHGITTLNSKIEPFYCIPWDDYHYIGPTETVYEGDPDEVRTDSADLEFILSETNELFPGLDIDKSKVLSTWAGVRPLTYDVNVPEGSRSRILHDLCKDGLSGVYAMTAGPIMSHRSAGREVTRKLRSTLSPTGTPTKPSYEPLSPEEKIRAQLVATTGSMYNLGDVRKAVSNEYARSLTDILYRRSGLGWRQRFTEEELEITCEMLGEILGWSEVQRAAEIRRFKEEIEHLFGIP